MSKQIVSNYTFNSPAKTITLTDFTTVRLDRLQLITDVTTNTILYNFADSTVSTASVATNVITLSTVGSAASADKLSIIYDALSGDPVYDGYKELASLSAGSLNADLVPSTDVSGYKWVSLQVTGTYTGTIAYQGSNDGSTWTGIVLQNTASPTAIGSTSTSSSPITVTGPVHTRYIRMRMTAYTSGTATGVLELYTVPTAPTVAAVAATQAGTWSVGSNSATGSAVPANAFFLGVNNAGNLGGLNSVANTGDGSAGAGTMPTGNTVYNGTTWDRQRTATTASGTTGTGVPAAGDMNLSASALPTVNAAGRYTPSMSDNYGRKVVIAGTLRDLVGTQTTTISASTSETTIVTAAASVFNDLTALVVSNTSATAVRVDFRDTTAGSILFSLYIPAGDVRGATFNRPIPQTTVNTNWTAQSSASVTDLRIYAVFDKNK